MEVVVPLYVVMGVTRKTVDTSLSGPVGFGELDLLIESESCCYFEVFRSPDEERER